MSNPQLNITELTDFKSRAAKLWNIRTKDNKLVNYRPNEGQVLLDKIIQEEEKRSVETRGVKQVKLIVLKSRQVGISTDTAIRNMDALVTLPMCNVLVLAHDGMTTDILYDIYKRAYDSMPAEIDVVDNEGNLIQANIPIKPNEKSYSGKKLHLDRVPGSSNLLDSRLSVQTAGAGDNVGKGLTLNRTHFSEAANYVNFTSVLNSTTQALPTNGEVYSVIESTANGVSGVGEGFYKLWVKSTKEWEDFQSGRIHSFEGYRPVFLPWYIMSEYRKPLINGKLTSIDNIDFGSEEAKREFLETEEKLMNEFDVPIEGINWYRYCVKEKCSFSLRESKRYYPTFPEDAFLSTDNGYFDNAKLFVLKRQYEERPPQFLRGNLDDNLNFNEDKFGNLQIIEHPDPNYINRYIVSLDPSAGVQDGDYAPMKVYDRLTQNWVARWYGKADEDVLAEEFMRLGYYYNEALLIPESNLATVINIIKPDGMMPYTGDVWMTESKSGNVTYGFQNNVQSRKILLDTYKSWLRTDYSRLMDLTEVDEHMNFIKVVKHGGVRYEAASGHHDDLVVANALTVYAAENWDEEIGQLNDQRNDISKIISVSAQRNKPNTRHNRIGLRFEKRSTNHYKPNKFTNLGKRK